MKTKTENKSKQTKQPWTHQFWVMGDGNRVMNSEKQQIPLESSLLHKYMLVMVHNEAIDPNGNLDLRITE